MITTIALFGVLISVAISLRIYLLLPSQTPLSAKPKQRPKSPSSSTCSIAVFMGSGGHTSEMKTLLSTLDKQRYTPRKYILCHGDEMSLRAISAIEGGSKDWDILLLPRARKVGQSIPSTLVSTLYTILLAFQHVFLLPLLQNPREPYTDVLLVNGPGTCVVLVLISWIRRILGLKYSKIVYVESWARVRSLSLSGKLVRRFVDRFVVQWPEADQGGGECKGWLV